MNTGSNPRLQSGPCTTEGREGGREGRQKEGNGGKKEARKEMEGGETPKGNSVETEKLILKHCRETTNDQE